jgi:hypothetical protein
MKIEVRKPTKEEIEKTKSWGIWTKEVSTFPYSYDEKETCLILEGKAEVTGNDGQKAAFGKGDWVVFPEGLECTWKILQPIKKHYKFG